MADVAEARKRGKNQCRKSKLGLRASTGRPKSMTSGLPMPVASGLGKRTFAHSGEGLAQFCDWLVATSGGKPEYIHVAIEIPHGAVVETLTRSRVQGLCHQSEAARPFSRSLLARGRQGR